MVMYSFWKSDDACPISDRKMGPSDTYALERHRLTSSLCKVSKNTYNNKTKKKKEVKGTTDTINHHSEIRVPQSTTCPYSTLEIKEKTRALILYKSQITSHHFLIKRSNSSALKIRLTVKLEYVSIYSTVLVSIEWLLAKIRTVWIWKWRRW